jgi:hypothetical protein
VKHDPALATPVMPSARDYLSGCSRPTLLRAYSLRIFAWLPHRGTFSYTLQGGSTTESNFIRTLRPSVTQATAHTTLLSFSSPGGGVWKTGARACLVNRFGLC